MIVSYRNLLLQKVHHLLHLVELWAQNTDALLSKGQGGFDVTYLNGNEKIISNRNVYGQIVLENVYMTQG